MPEKTLKARAKRKKGINPVVRDGDLRYLSMDVLVLAAEGAYSGNTMKRELAVIPFSGEFEVSFPGGSCRMKRKDVFSEKGSALYLPANTEFSIRADSKTASEMVFCWAKAAVKKGKRFPRFVPASEAKQKLVGKGNWKRKVVDIIDLDTDAERLVVGETYNRPGCWSSFPPHKHDKEIPGKEADMEEIYLFRISPPQGFGLQRIYSGRREDCFAVQDYDAVKIPVGYHPVVAMPGYDLYYLWVLAGKKRKLMPNTDPRYRWLLET